MALWGISTTSDTAANNNAIPKYLHNVDRNRSPYNCFADIRGWVQRRYKTTEHSGISTRFYDEVLIPVTGLTTSGGSLAANYTSSPGLGQANIVGVFFEDPNKATPISIGAGGTNFISTNTTAYVHLVYNEIVYATKGAQVFIQPYTVTGVTTGSQIVAYASSISPTATVGNWVNPSAGPTLFTGYNGQITNRVAFAFTSPSSGIGTILTINCGSGVVGVITDINGGTGVTTTFFATDAIRNVGGAGTYRSVKNDGSGVSIGIGTTALTVKA
jgi:hypothetical protein